MENNPLFVSNWNNVASEGRNELVFENKNKEYGAYVIRKKYNSALLVGILISVVVLSLSVGIPLLRSIFGEKEEEEKKDKYKVVVFTEANLLKEKVVPKTKPIEEKPKLAEKLKFTIPEPTKEELKEPPKTMKELENKNIGDENQKGENLNDFGNIDDGDGLIPTEVVVEFPIDVDQEAEPAGGWEAYVEYMADNYDQNLTGFEELKNGIDIDFKVTSEGDVVDIKIKKGSGCKACDQEALRVFKSYKGKFKSAKRNGRVTNSTLGVHFTFPDSEQ
ncbi:MAG: energy transducer TonB [Flavobacteriales bacterium]